MVESKIVPIIGSNSVCAFIEKMITMPENDPIGYQSLTKVVEYEMIMVLLST